MVVSATKHRKWGTILSAGASIKTDQLKGRKRHQTESKTTSQTKHFLINRALDRGQENRSQENIPAYKVIPGFLKIILGDGFCSPSICKPFT